MTKKGHVCAVCNTNIAKSIFKSQCGVCKRYYHPGCANLTEVEVRVMYEKKLPWTCSKCQPAQQQSRTNYDILRRTSFNQQDDQIPLSLDTALAQHSRASNQFSFSGQNRRQTMYQISENHPMSCGESGQAGTSQRKRNSQYDEPNEDVSSLRSILLDLRGEVRSLKDEVVTMKESLDFINAMYESQKHTTKVLGEMIDDVKKENSKLRADVTFLQNKLHVIDQQQNGKKLMINGPYNRNDSDDEIKLKTFKVLKFVSQDGNEKSFNWYVPEKKNASQYSLCVKERQHQMQQD
ncbi:unnamed protein product [Ceutorhynchus assimilis]|uniref:PHD-type domain-containing protein n=1 Tax=Ceutorhynchus assimilis TaxID=467358 RepID=A0A9N9QKG8_9CUCU|nr:unnamed protein product [Ceutorhynchus assimilis]